MSELIPFKLELTGETSDSHQFQGYDGYMALAGFAWTLSLMSNYVETGKIRQRGDFPGRDSVRATAISEGSVVAEFFVLIQQHPAEVLGITGVSATASAFLYDIVKRIIARNLGQDTTPSTDVLDRLLRVRGGDIEALVAKSEASVRQTHSVIGNGANRIRILGGHNIINNYNEQTREYVKQNVEDRNISERDFSVSAFNVNSGYGSVFDNEIGRVVPISMTRDVLQQVRRIFTWGLDQYANRTGGRVLMKYWRILAMDGTPKRYIVTEAKAVPMGEEPEDGDI